MDLELEHWRALELRAHREPTGKNKRAARLARPRFTTQRTPRQRRIIALCAVERWKREGEPARLTFPEVLHLTPEQARHGVMTDDRMHSWAMANTRSMENALARPQAESLWPHGHLPMGERPWWK